MGAEVVRMYKTLLGSVGFRKGMDLYFKRHDGQAVTCEDSFAAMGDANGADFANFLWYSQAGTPRNEVTSSYNADAWTYSLKFNQEVPPRPGQPVKEPMFIPVAVGLLDSSGKDIPLTSIYHDGLLEPVATNCQQVCTTVFRVTKKEEEFVFSGIAEQPIPSLLSGYCSPVRLDSDLTDSDMFFLLEHDSDEFNRWEAGQILARKLMLNLVADIQQNKSLVLNPKFVDGMRSILNSTSLDKEFIAQAITLPGEGEIMGMMGVADPDAVHAVHGFIRKQLALHLKEEFLSTLKENRNSEPYVFNHQNKGRRALKNTALVYLASLDDPEMTSLALNEYNAGTDMTEQFSALAAIAQNPGQARDDVLADFYKKWSHDLLVVNKWFALQAKSNIPGNVVNVQNLLNHPAFDFRNPNKVYSLIGGLCGSPVNLHVKDGSGYKFLGEVVLQPDKINPQVASRMVSAFSRWRRYDEGRQALAKAQLERILSANELSENVYEIAPTLFPYVAVTVKILNWDIFRKMKFANAVERYGLSYALESFSTLVGIFSMAKMHGEVRCLLLDIVVFNKGLLSEVMRLSNGSITPLQAYGDLIKALADNSMVEDALEFCLEAMGIGLEVGVPLCNSLLKCFVLRSNVGVVKSMFEYMKVFGPSPNVYTYSTMMDLYTKGHTLDVDEANKILVEMENHGIQPNAVTYSMYLRGLCKIGKADSAWEFLKDLQHKGLKYDNYCCNAVILGFCHEGDLNKALAVLDEMKKCGLSPDVHSYSILIDGFCKEGNVLEALNLFEEMHRREIMPNVVTYTSLLRGFCSEGEMEIAIKLFHEFRDKGYGRDLIAYSILIDGCCQHGDLHGACELWQEMIHDKFTPDIFCHTSIIYSYCKNHQVQEAMHHFKIMINDGTMPNVVTCTIIIDGFCKEGRIVEAFRFLNEMEEWGIIPNMFTYTVIIDALYKKGTSCGAWEVFGAMIKRALIPDVVLYTILIDGLLKTLNVDKALMLYETMSERGIEPNILTYTSLINGLCNAGMLSKALKLLEEMNWKGFKPDRVLYSSIISCCCRCKDMKKALEFVNSMETDGFGPDGIVYSSIISGYCRSNNMEIALELFYKLEKQEFKLDRSIYTSIIAAYCRCNDIKKAVQFFNRMVESGLLPDVYVYTCLIDRCSKLSAMNIAELLLAKMIIVGFTPKAINYMILIDGYRKVGDEKAFELHKCMVAQGS